MYRDRRHFITPVQEQQNVLVYIDYENIHNILGKYQTNTQEKDFFKVIKKYCDKNNLRILDIFVYCNFDLNDLHESYHQTWLLQNNVEIKHTSNRGKNFADLQITVDIMEQLYDNKFIDGFVIISSDKDMVPLIKAVRRKNKEAHLITTVKDFDYGVSVFPTSHTFLEHLLDIRDNGKQIDYVEESTADKIYNMLHTFIAKQTTPSNVAFETFYLEQFLKRLQLLKSVLLSELRKLEQDGRICFYKYTHSTHAGIAKTYIGISTTAQLPNLSRHFGVTYAPETEYIKESRIRDCYKA
ncbi:NYN domain-containing protein [Paenibacillus sp. 22594]|uniref:NYN domain-containing protein n=1 Tax=Paenibacillus sp. 22594 TaxID=3453947 RepID=UPI003F84831F